MQPNFGVVCRDKRPPSTRDVVIAEDSPPLAALYARALREAGFSVRELRSAAACLAAIAQQPPAVAVIDLGLRDMDGLELLARIRAEYPSVMPVVITSNASISTAVTAMRQGAADFIVKPFLGDRLVTIITAAAKTAAAAELAASPKNLAPRSGYRGFVGSSPAMRVVYRTIESAASSRATVFITGESGTGKEVCAQAIHATSERARKSFVAINCAAIPRDLMESEIFGHVKGAFTGASGDRRGAVGEAQGGTLFLDEICEMDLDLQAKLLRLIQSSTYQRVGSDRLEQADIRILCATNRNPRDEVAAGRFREDLFYRLHVIPLHLPPLRERGSDVLEIADALLATYANEEKKPFRKLADDARAAIAAYPWPGNVRELQNALRNAIVLHEGEELVADMLPQWVRMSTPASLPPLPTIPAPAPVLAGRSADTIRPLWMVEREAILEALEICGGNVPRAAIHLGVVASTIYRKKAAWESEGQTG